MSLSNALVFTLTLLLAAMTPGPGITAIVARVLGRGAGGALMFGFGMAIGDVVWLSCAVGGLAALAKTFNTVFLVVKWIGIAYLLYTAVKTWRAPAMAQDVAAKTARERPASLFAAGLAVTLGNPKVMVFYLALLPAVLDLSQVGVLGYTELVAITLAVLAVVFSVYVLLAARARRLFTSPVAVRRVNRGSAVAMTGTAAWIASQ